MPINDLGRRLPSDVDDGTFSTSFSDEVSSVLAERFGIRDEASRYPSPNDLVADVEQEFQQVDFRNSYEGVVIERIEKRETFDTYLILRQDQRTGTARTFDKMAIYRPGQTVAIVRPQEKEDENDWYIQTRPRQDNFESYALNIGEVSNGMLEFTTYSNQSSATLQKFSERIRIQDTRLVVLEGGVYDLSFSGKLSGSDDDPPPTISSTNKFFLTTEEISACVKINERTYTLGFGNAYQGFFDENDNVLFDARHRKIYQTTPTTIPKGKFVDTVEILGKDIIVVEPCDDFPEDEPNGD